MPSPSAGDDQSAVDVVEKFKEQLQQLTLEEENGLAVESILGKLEALPLTREILEITRIGATVNEIRKRSVSIRPEVSKRCRGLIKTWQKVAEVNGPLSSCDGSSNGGTPSLVSPALGSGRRGLTPKTPSFKPTQQRVSSTGLQYSSFPSSETSPSIASIRNGSYAPNSSGASIIHKSASVGTTLCALNSEDARGRNGGGVTPNADVESQFSLDSLPNGSEAATFAHASNQHPGERTPIPTITLKRTKAVDNLTLKLKADSKSSSGSPPISYRAVSAARKNVQSTAQLVAQMSESLPEHIPAWDTLPAQPAPAKGEPLDGVSAAKQQRVPVVEPDQLSSPAETLCAEPGELPAGGQVPKAKESKEARRERKRLRAERKERKAQKKAAKKPRLEPPAIEVKSAVTSEVAMVAAIVQPIAHGRDEQTQSTSDGVATAELTGLEDPVGLGEAPEVIDLTIEEAHSSPKVITTDTVKQGPRSWFDHLFTPDIMGKLRVEEDPEGDASPNNTSSSTSTVDRDLSVVAANGSRRNLILLPYLDLGTPDFTEHALPDPSRFIAPRRFPSK